ncbi:Zinc ABC transporter, periplasmic-binding protein ZnuA [hydrothermal vent metagenome]|uniref:Zinc ABC transporter, periplasmic-binding protein ZnuA n=1 Tax=hydrothermal vent metagenome TaxID=652676 RepID=A0A1W1D0W6_9ZZZZ
MHTLILFLLISSTLLFANLKAIVSIPPQVTFLKAIAGDKVDITLMVEAGNSPHTYEPKPSQMKAIAKADVYFSIAVEFEDTWLPKFQNLNKNMQTISLAKGIDKSPMNPCTAHSHAKHTHDESTDPHIWTSPRNVKIMAQTLYDALILLDSKNRKYYQKNLALFIKHIEETDKSIQKTLSTLNAEGRRFMVFHPSWGYFAKEYFLKQIAVEVGGKSPKPKAMVKLIKKAQIEKVSAIFTQAEFSDASAKIIAKELNIPVIKVSPLAEDWSNNLIKIANAIAGKE